MDEAANYLALATIELESGNFTEAERYFKKVLEIQQSKQAWVGLGNTRLAIFYKSISENRENAVSYIQGAFNCYERAKSLDQNIDEIEIDVIKTSFQLVKTIYSDAKNDFDKYKNANHNQKLLTGLALAALFTNTTSQASDILADGFNQKEAEKKISANHFANKIQAAVILKERAIPFVEVNRNLLHNFINEITNIEYALQWHTTDEKEKKRILIEQEAAKRKVQDQQTPKKQQETGGKKLNPWVKFTLWIIGLIIVFRVAQIFFMSNP